MQKPLVDSGLIRIVVKDILKALIVLDTIDYGDTNKLQSFIINTHCLKEMLVTIGQAELSARADKLAMAAYEGNLKFVLAETPTFLDELWVFVSKKEY
jgi:hypothetical protein